MSAAVVRSERHQRMPVKYSRLEPASTSSAAILLLLHQALQFSRRAACSCRVIG